MNTKARGKERREYPRVCISCHLRYLLLPNRSPEYHNAAVLEVSQGGLRFSTAELFQRSSCFLLDLYLPGTGPRRFVAKVAWIKPVPAENGYQVGGAFVEPSPDVGAAVALLASGH